MNDFQLVTEDGQLITNQTGEPMVIYSPNSDYVTVSQEFVEEPIEPVGIEAEESSTASAIGDPHICTFDGKKYTV